ncbi:unnamed protein product [Malus baccata var. baccata]
MYAVCRCYSHNYKYNSLNENPHLYKLQGITQCQILRSTDQLTAAVDVGEGDAMLEIRLRTGSLINVLINAGAFVLAIKKDPHMATHVSERFAETDRFKNVNCQGSTLEKVIWVEILPAPKPPTKWKLLPKQKALFWFLICGHLGIEKCIKSDIRLNCRLPLIIISL